MSKSVVVTASMFWEISSFGTCKISVELELMFWDISPFDMSKRPAEAEATTIFEITSFDALKRSPEPEELFFELTDRLPALITYQSRTGKTRHWGTGLWRRPRGPMS